MKLEYKIKSLLKYKCRNSFLQIVAVKSVSPESSIYLLRNNVRKHLYTDNRAQHSDKVLLEATTEKFILKEDCVVFLLK